MKSNNIIELGCYFLWTILLLIIVYLNAKGRVHFGLGLGDFIISVFIVIAILIIDGFVLMNTKYQVGSNFDISIRLVAILFLIFILLKMTILRGGVSPWNGQIFFK